MCLAAVFKQIHAQESERTILADGQRAMVTQNQQILLANINDQPLAFIEIKRNALIVMVGKIVMNLHRKLSVEAQTVLLHRNRDAIRRMHMDDAAGVFTRTMDGAVNGKARRIDEIGRFLFDIALKIDLHQRRGCHFIEHQAIGIDEEPFFAIFVGQACRDMGKHQVGPGMECAKTVSCGKIAAQFPFDRRNLALEPFKLCRIGNIEPGTHFQNAHFFGWCRRHRQPPVGQLYCVRDHITAKIASLSSIASKNIIPAGQ